MAFGCAGGAQVTMDEQQVLTRASHHDLVQPYLPLRDPVCTPPELLTAPECSSMPPCLCTCYVFCQNILSQLLCSKDVLRLSVGIHQLIVCQPGLDDPLPQDSFCWIVTPPFLVFSTPEYKLLKSGDCIYRSPLPNIAHSSSKECLWNESVN